jgi:hypothetical protein
MIQNQIQKNEQNKKNELINNNDDGTKSVVLSLETLSKEYDTVLIKYNQAQKDYINYLKTQSTNNACSKYNSNSKEIDQACYEEIWKKSGCVTPNVVSASSDWAKSQTLNGLIYDSFYWATLTDSQHRDGCYGTTTNFSTATEPNYNINAEPLIDIQGATFWGTKGISEGAASSIEQCKAMCSADSSCSGATFNPDKAYCWIRSGDSQITVGMPNDYAIVPENLKYLKIIQGLSEKLTNINQKILQIINQGEPLYTKQDLQRKQQTMILNQNYKKLTEEREKVEKTIKKYQDLNKAQNEGEIVITKNYSTFIAGILIFLIIICLFIKMLPNTAAAAANATVQQGGSLKSNTYILIFIIILITFIICNKILK